MAGDLNFIVNFEFAKPEVAKIEGLLDFSFCVEIIREHRSCMCSTKLE